MHLYKKSAKAVIAVITLIAVFLVSGCASFGTLKKATVNQWIEYNGKGNEFRTLGKRADTKVLSGEGTELYIGKNGGISLYDKDSGISWNSLPSFSNTFAADFYVTVFDGEKLLTLDTSGCRGAEKGFSYKAEGDTVTCLYELQAQSLTLQLPVVFSIKGKYLEVSVNIADCVVSEEARIISVSFLPYLGAIRYDENDTDFEAFGDYFLVPDGPGALMRTVIENENSSVVYSVYGKEHYEQSIPVAVGAFGIKSGSVAVAATVTEGAENAYIRVFRSNADSFNINRIYTEFIVTEISGSEGSINISKNSYSGKCAVMYEPLSDDSADYIGMAVSVRQALINSGILPGEKVEDEYPLFVSVVGSADGKRDGTVTSLQQAENLLSILKGKGINEINLILEGYFSGGISENSQHLKIPSKLGNKNDLSELISYAARQQLNVFAGVNILSSESGVASVKNISGDKKTFTLNNPLYPYFGEESFIRYHRSISELSSAFTDVLSYAEKNSIKGIAVLDSDISCISDYYTHSGTLTAYSEELISNLSSCAVKAELMLDGANMNTLRFADYIKNISFDTVIAESSEYSTVPFVPALLHSSCVYTGEAVNTQSITKLNLLKNVEYGAMPYYLWVFSDESDKYYDLTLNEAVDFYLKAEKDLGELTSKRITDHFEYESGVYCTVFDSETKVYVNYNNYSVLIGEVAVPPYDYLRIG